VGDVRDEENGRTSHAWAWTRLAEDPGVVQCSPGRVGRETVAGPEEGHSHRLGDAEKEAVREGERTRLRACETGAVPEEAHSHSRRALRDSEADREEEQSPLQACVKEEAPAAAQSHLRVFATAADPEGEQSRRRPSSPEVAETEAGREEEHTPGSPAAGTAAAGDTEAAYWPSSAPRHTTAAESVQDVTARLPQRPSCSRNTWVLILILECEVLESVNKETGSFSGDICGYVWCVFCRCSKPLSNSTPPVTLGVLVVACAQPVNRQGFLYSANLTVGASLNRQFQIPVNKALV
jgi:hypothetical protein